MTDTGYASTGIRLKLLPPPPVTLRSIAARVADEFDLTVDDLRGPCTKHSIAHPRHAAFEACRSVLREDGTHRYSLPQIGDYFGGRDHTSVLVGIRNHKKRVSEGRPA